MVCQRQELAHRIERVELRSLRIEFEGDPYSVLGGEIADLTHAVGGLAQITSSSVDRAHDDRALEGTCGETTASETVKQMSALVAHRKHPASRHTDGRHRKLAVAHEFQNVVLGLPGRLGAVEVHSSQLDGVPAGVACHAQHLG